MSELGALSPRPHHFREGERSNGNKGDPERQFTHVTRNATIFNHYHKGDRRAFGSILHRRPLRPDSRFLSRSVFTIIEINPIIILPKYTISDTDIDKRRENSI